MADPYVHFSEYRLGLKNEEKQKRNDRYFYGMRYSDDEEDEKVKLQKDKVQN